MPITPVPVATAKTRIYLVSDGVSNDRLIRAKTSAGALKHAASVFTVKAASQDDLVEALGAGVTVETAGQESEE